MIQFVLSAFAAHSMAFADASAQLTTPPRPARARLCASILDSQAGRAVSSKQLIGEIEAATEQVREVERNSKYAIGPDLLGQIQRIFRIFTAPFLGDRAVVVTDVAQPDAGLKRSKAIDQIDLSTQVADALNLIGNREHMYARLTVGRDAIQEKLLGIIGATLSKEELHQRALSALVPEPTPRAEIPESLRRPDMPLWGRVLTLGAAVGVSAGAGYLAGAQVPPPFLNAITGAATFATVMTGWIAIRETVMNAGYRALLKVKIWNQRLRERGERRERERLEDMIERADAQIETLQELVATVGNVERKNTFAYYGFNTELPLGEIASDSHAAAEAIERALNDSETVVVGPRVHVRVEFVLYFDGEEPKLLTFVNPTDNPYLNIPQYSDMLSFGFAM